MMRLQNPINFERQASGDDIFGSPGDNFSFGVINVNIDPTDEDTYETNAQNFGLVSFQNADIRMSVGLPQFSLTTFETIFVGKVKSASWTTEKLSLTLRDPDYLLTEEIQKNKYTGLGHEEDGDRSEGGPNLKDVEKPLLYGYGKNVNPVLIDASWQVYQFHDGEIEEIETIYDGGYEYGAAEFDMSAHGTASVWDWETISTPTGGQWITDHEEGLIRLATRPAFTLTGDVKGAITSTRPFNARAAYVVEAMMIDRLGITAADIIGASALDNIVPYPVGIFIRAGGMTLDKAIQSILGPIQCFLGYTVRGEYELRAFRKSDSTNKKIEAHEILNFKRLNTSPEAVNTLKFSYGHNWTVRSDDQLALNRSEEFSEFSQSEDRWSQFEFPFNDPSHAGKLREIKSLLINEIDAYSEVKRQWSWMATSDCYEITITQKPLGYLPGDTINIFYDGYGFNGGKKMVAYNVRENGRSGTTVLRVWGNNLYNWD
jgi:hypothetical protein